MRIRRSTPALALACLAVILPSCSKGVTSTALDSIRAEDINFQMKLLE